MARVLVFTSILVLIGCGTVCLGAERAAASLDEATAKLEAWDTTPADRKVAMQTITNAGIRSLPHVRALLKSKNWLARSDALALASTIKASDRASLIAGGLKDRNWSVRARAAGLAGDLAGADRAKVKPALEEALSDPIVRARLPAYAALAKWEPDSGVVLKALDDPDPAVAYWAAHNCIEGNRLDKLSPAVRARLAESIIETFRERQWQNIDAKSVRTVLSLGEDTLYDAIAGEEPPARRRAVMHLGSMGDAATMNLMFRFTSDPDTSVRRNAIAAICSNCTSRSAPRLLEFARSSSDQGIQSQLLRALGRLKHRPAIPLLLKAAGSQNSSRRRAAFRALATMGDKTLAPKLIAMYKRETQSWERRNMIDPIARLLGEDAVAFLKEAASASDQSTRSQALHAARSYLKEGDRTSIILELIRNEDNDHVRRSAISNLSQAESVKAVELLIEVMKSGGPQSRRAAAGMLGRSKSPAGVKAVIDAFEAEQDPQVRMAMLGALAQAQARQAIPALKKALTSDDARMKVAALRALAQFDNALDNDFIIRIVKTEEDSDVLQTCMGLMNQRGIRDGRLLPRFAELMESDAGDLRHAVLQYVSHLEDVRATKILCTAIKEDEAERNQVAALEFLVARLAAKRTPPKALVGPLGEALKAERAQARRSILSALAGQMDPVLAPVVLGVLKGDTDAGVRLAAAEAIRHVAGKQIVPQLIEAAKAEEHTPTLIVLIDALASTEDDRAVPLFRDQLESAETSVQAAALRAIGRFRTSSLIPLYVRRYGRSTSVDVRLTALRNMQGVGDRRTLETVLSALKDDDPRIRRAALDIASGLVDTRLALALVDRLSEKDIGREAARTIADAVGRIRSREVASRLLAAAKKADDADVRVQVFAALVKSGDRRAIPMLAAAAKKEDASSGLALEAIAGLAELGARDHAGLCIDVARSSTDRLSRSAASAAASLGGKAGFAYLADRFGRGSEREKRFYAPLLAEADPERADVVLRSALADARDEELIAVLCSSLAVPSDENIAAVRGIAVGGFGPEARLGAVRFLGKGASAEVRNTLALMTEPGRGASVRAAALLQQTSVYRRANSDGSRPPTIEVAVRWIDGSEPELRAAAAETLAAHASLPEAKCLIPVARQDDDKRVRASAIRALGSMTGDKQAEQVLIELIEEDDADTAADVVRALGLLRSQTAVVKLSKLAGAGELSVRVAAVEALGRIATPDALRAVESAFQQPDVDRVRAAAALALGATGRAEHVPRLTEALKAAPGLEARAACAEALGRLGGEAAGAALVEALKQDSALVREAAVRALAAFKTARPADVFKRMLDDDDVRVADAARRALAALPKRK